jgi:hypothetical protein
MHFAASWNIAGSIPDEVTVSFSLPNPSSHTMALGSTLPVTEVSTRYLAGIKGGRRVRLTTSQPSVGPLPRNCLGILDVSTLWVSTACLNGQSAFRYLERLEFELTCPHEVQYCSTHVDVLWCDAV